MKKPNILFINTDQHHFNACSFLGNAYVDTPNIDKLYKNGTAFINAYCTNPVCAPARSSWATGLYTSETGVNFNELCMPGDIRDIGQILNDNGYYAAHAGKWHVSGRDVRKSFNCLFYGGKGKDIVAGGAEFYDIVSTHAALDFLSRYNHDKPFFLEIGYINPHDICEYLHNHERKYIPDLQGLEHIDEDDLPPFPENFFYDKNETAVQKEACRGNQPAIHTGIRLAVDKWTEYQWRYFLWNYYRYVEKADTEIGKILSFIENSSFRDNTIIIFACDHGESSGSHKMFQKFTLYEESIHVPLIVGCLGDGIKVKKSFIDDKHLISGVDVFSTICDYANIKTPENVHGLSLKPLVEGDDVSWRNYIYVENNLWERAIVTEHYKLVTEYIPDNCNLNYPPNASRNSFGASQLFDLRDDPGETRNLANIIEYKCIVEDMKNILIRHERSLNPAPIQLLDSEDENTKIILLLRDRLMIK